MTLFERIVQELASAPEPLLLQVLDLIQEAKESSPVDQPTADAPRIPGLHQGQVWMSEDFNEPLPDEFWLGETE